MTDCVCTDRQKFSEALEFFDFRENLSRFGSLILDLERFCGLHCFYRGFARQECLSLKDSWSIDVLSCFAIIFIVIIVAAVVA